MRLHYTGRLGEMGSWRYRRKSWSVRHGGHTRTMGSKRSVRCERCARALLNRCGRLRGSMRMWNRWVMRMSVMTICRSYMMAAKKQIKNIKINLSL